MIVDTSRRVAVLERFGDPSRRCDPRQVAHPGDELTVWDLAEANDNPRALLKRLPCEVLRWVAGPMPEGGRRKLLHSCLATGGAPLGALIRAPELYRRVRGGEIDRLVCFSAKDFELACLLAKELDTSLEEVLRHGTQYFGEFAFELLAVLPYAYWLHDRGRLEFTVSTADTRCLYYFSANHEERDVPRRYVPITEYPIGESDSGFRYDIAGFPKTLDTRSWLPPPYKKVFADKRFRFDRETCIVSNKSSDEHYLGRGFSINSMDTELVLEVIGRLRKRYRVIYNRPRSDDIVNDHQPIRETGDIEAVQHAYPDVLIIQELHAAHPELPFNELQLRLFAGCERFVSVLGGASYLSSYFGGTNVVFAVQGWEVSCGAFENWFHRFSGTRVIAKGTPRDLLDSVDRELL
jgi:hypothetical protein